MAEPAALQLRASQAGGLEAVALRFALIAEILDSAVPGKREVIATVGGLLGARAWTQIMSKALGKRIAASRGNEASSRGLPYLPWSL